MMLGGGCGSSSPGPGGPAGGPLMGALDTHCSDGDGGVTARQIGMCQTPGGVTDAAAPDDGGAPVSDYGETMFNAEGNDDDCKYHVVWTSTPVRENTSVTFTVTLTKLTDMTPATGAGMRAEVYLNDTHPAQPPKQATEAAGGKYTLGPVKFDTPGNWTIRFHFFEDCDDTPEDSPHGHAAFYVHVPDPKATDAGAAD